MSRVNDFDLQPTLSGETLALRPLEASDCEALYAVARDPLVWEQHPEPTRHQRGVFEGFFATALASRGALVVETRSSREVIGSSRYYELDAGARSVAIGYTFLARSHWGGAANREMKRLMLDHAFRWVDTAWFHVGAGNLRSRRAMEKLGAELAFEGQREQAGSRGDYVYYRIDAARWRQDSARDAIRPAER